MLEVLLSDFTDSLMSAFLDLLHALGLNDMHTAVAALC